MNHFEIQNLIAFGALLLGVVTTVSGIFFWFINSIKFQYGLERDLKHLRNNHDQLIQNLSLLLTEFDRRFDSLENNIDSLDKVLVEIKSIINLKLHK